MMIAIRNGSFADIEAEQAGTAINGEVNRPILNASLSCQHQPDGQWHTRRVHHAIPTEASVWLREAMAPGTDRALALGRLHRESP